MANNEYKNCYFCKKDYDMGTIIDTCYYNKKNIVWRCNCLNCKNFISKEKADEIIKNYLKKGNKSDK